MLGEKLSIFRSSSLSILMRYLMFFNKSIEEISIDDVRGLVRDKIPEGKTLDYKVHLQIETKDERKEILTDICAFANASGGIIIYGIEEEAGTAKDLIGVKCDNQDVVKLKLDSLVRDGIEPRIWGVQVVSIPFDTEHYIFIIKVPSSWSRPHVVTLSNSWRFYSRNSAGKYQLDYFEIKNLFIASENTIDKINRFRLDRISSIVAGNTPVPLGKNKNSYVILHIIPIFNFDLNVKININQLDDDPKLLAPLRNRGYNHRINYDGILTYTPDLSNISYTYLQLYRNGIIEAVEQSTLDSNNANFKEIPIIPLRREILALVNRTRTLYKQYQISLPFMVMLSLIGVKDYFLKVDFMYHGFNMMSIDRDHLVIPEVIV